MPAAALEKHPSRLFVPFPWAPFNPVLFCSFAEHGCGGGQEWKHRRPLTHAICVLCVPLLVTPNIFLLAGFSPVLRSMQVCQSIGINAVTCLRFQRPPFSVLIDCYC